MATTNGAKPKEPKFPPIPAEWKVELPDEGYRGSNAIGGCRSIEEGYDRQGVLGQGTYGEVYKAIDLATNEVVAAKKIKMDNEKEGFPITAIREIKILSTLALSNLKMDDRHLLRDHVITLREIVRSAGHHTNNYKGSIYMIFDYMDHDMTGLLARSQREGPPFSPGQIKCYMRQLLLGLSLLQANHVLHRDLKNSNLLINNRGILKIGDFGLARYRPHALDDGQGGSARMTNRVITLWYRPPELLLGAQSYGPEIDIWSAGCIMFELLTSKPLFSANDELGMCDRIFSVVGKANERTMPGCTKYSNYQHVDFANPKFPNASRLRNHLARFGIPDRHAVDLMEGMLQLDPKKRISAKEAAAHAWFYTEPLPLDPSQIPRYQSSHEMGMKRARQAAAAGAAGRRGGPGAPPAKHPRPAAFGASAAVGQAPRAGFQASYVGEQRPPAGAQQAGVRAYAAGPPPPGPPLPPPAPHRGPPPGAQPPPAAWQSQRR